MSVSRKMLMYEIKMHTVVLGNVRKNPNNFWSLWTNQSTLYWTLSRQVRRHKAVVTETKTSVNLCDVTVQGLATQRDDELRNLWTKKVAESRNEICAISCFLPVGNLLRSLPSLSEFQKLLVPGLLGRVFHKRFETAMNAPAAGWPTLLRWISR